MLIYKQKNDNNKVAIENNDNNIYFYDLYAR